MKDMSEWHYKINESFNRNYESSVGYGALGGFLASTLSAGFARGIKGIRNRNLRVVPFNSSIQEENILPSISSLSRSSPSFVNRPAPSSPPSPVTRRLLPQIPAPPPSPVTRSPSPEIWRNYTISEVL